MLTKTLTKSSYLWGVYAILYLPIIVLGLYSFNGAIYSVTWTGWTLRWYKALLENHDLIQSALHSFIIASLSATLGTLLGTMGVMVIHRYAHRSKQYFHAQLLYVLIIPDLILGISFLTLYDLLGLPLGFFTLLCSHVTFTLPFVVVTCMGRLSTLNPYLLESAQDLGATEFTLFKKVFVPLLMPAIMASWLLSFTLSLDDVVVSYFTTGPGFQTLPLHIYALVRVGISPEINAVSTLLLLASIVLVILAERMIKRGQVENGRPTAPIASSSDLL